MLYPSRVQEFAQQKRAMQQATQMGQMYQMNQMNQMNQGNGIPLGVPPPHQVFSPSFSGGGGVGNGGSNITSPAYTTPGSFMGGIFGHDPVPSPAPSASDVPPSPSANPTAAAKQTNKRTNSIDSPLSPEGGGGTKAKKQKSTAAATPPAGGGAAAGKKKGGGKGKKGPTTPSEE